jgi:hypothetical protein
MSNQAPMPPNRDACLGEFEFKSMNINQPVEGNPRLSPAEGFKFIESQNNLVGYWASSDG